MHALIAVLILHSLVRSSGASALGISPKTRDIGFSNNILNCTADSVLCGGPGPGFGTCCKPGFGCNFRRGIPVCLALHSSTYNFGFDSNPCEDPYLYRCDVILNVEGFCCPIGTSCLQTISGPGNPVQCVNAVGVTSSALPSTTLGFIPSATPVPGNSKSIIYDPQNSWNISNDDMNCTISGVIRSTSIVNASISFNYTGPSIMVHTVSSPNGGLFSLLVDGFNTTSVIDTYSGPGNMIPSCYPRQFPGFIITPPEYDKHINHTITLVYIGQSKQTPEGDVNQNPSVRFDAFAIPSFPDSRDNAVQNSVCSRLSGTSLIYISAFIVLILRGITASLGF